MNSKEQPVDMAHLRKYTGDDHALNADILALFETQCNEWLGRLEALSVESGDEKGWQELTHTIKGAARNLGAFPLADAAADAEKALAQDRGALLAAVQRIKVKSAAVQAFIEDFLKREG